MRAYIAGIVCIAFIHCYLSIQKCESPLNWQFLVLISSPFVFLIWKDVARLRLDVKGSIEIEKLKDEVNRVITEVTHGKSINSKSIDALFKSVSLNDWLTLVLARMLMRKALVFLNPGHNLGVSPSLKKLIQISFESGKLSDQERGELEQLRDITFYAEWWGGKSPTHAEWDWALTNSKDLVTKLFGKIGIA